MNPAEINSLDRILGERVPRGERTTTLLINGALVLSPFAAILLTLLMPGGAVLPPLLGLLAIYRLAPKPHAVSHRPGRSLKAWMADNMEGWERETDWGLIWRLVSVPVGLLAIWASVFSCMPGPVRNIHALTCAVGMTIVSTGLLCFILIQTAKTARRAAFASRREIAPAAQQFAIEGFARAA